MIGADAPLTNLTISKASPNATSTTGINSANNQIEFPNLTGNVPNEKINVEETKSIKEKDYYKYIYKQVNASVRSITLKDLRHFSSYTISIRACRAAEVENPEPNCSNEVISYQRTGKIGLYLMF